MNVASDELEERADFVPDDVLRDGTALNDFFDEIHASLIARGLVLLVGPRGCGKTHLMRYTWLKCCERPDLPFAVYASFNRYLRLEPLLRSRPDALSVFQTWVLVRIILASDESAERTENRKAWFSDHLQIPAALLSDLVAKIERGATLSETEEGVAQKLSIDSVASAITAACSAFKRKRAVILLDDAALTLTPEYLVEFFDIVRVLKRTNISPKASVYPGSTEYGPRFHASHEGRTLPAWLPIDHPNYSLIMQAIAERRYAGNATLSPETHQLLQFAAFGVPRAYLTMLRDYDSSSSTTEQQKANRVVQLHAESRLEEYRSLILKIPRLATLIKAGEEFFKIIGNELRLENDRLANSNEKQILVGLPTSDLKPLPARMINLLVEAGLLFEHAKVSHGPERIYNRYTPHVAWLIATRALSGRSRSGAKAVLEVLLRKHAKHPLRRSLSSILSLEQLAALQLDLPACDYCHAPRINESQLFCHQCGHKLVDHSTFTRCMTLNLDKVPGLTQYQLEQMLERKIVTVGDLLSIQDPGTELRKIRWVGAKMADRILGRVQAYVDEFLS